MEIVLTICCKKKKRKNSDNKISHIIITHFYNLVYKTEYAVYS